MEIEKSNAETNYRGIRRLREQLGISQLELATKAGVNQSLLSKYERGDVKNPPHSALKKLADAAGVTLDELNTACTTVPMDAEPIYVGKKPEFIPQYEMVITLEDLPYKDAVFAGQAVTQVQAPSYLEKMKGAYCIKMPSAAMAPRYRKGDQLFVNPLLPIQDGDDVAVNISHGGVDAILIREARISADGTMTLHTLDSDAVMDIEGGTLHVIQGSVRAR
jgi:transcriptional regulator with XRE-family HTH domain